MTSTEGTLQHLVSGTIAGILSTGVLYPLELVKTRMQVIGNENVVYRSLRKATVTIWKTEGSKGFFQGVTPAVVAAGGSWGGYFYFYEYSKNRKLAMKGELRTSDFLASGIEAGTVLVFITNPLWVIKTQLALQAAERHNTKHYAGMSDAFKTILRNEGVRGLYKGLLPALALTSHGAIQFASYENLKIIAESLRPQESKQSQPAAVSLVMGGISKVIASVSTYPLQVVKSHMQQRESFSSSGEIGKRYINTLDCIQKIWKREGVVGFYRGLIPNVLKVVPNAALTFLIYEESMKIVRDSTLAHSIPAPSSS